ncbi:MULTISPECIES: amidohydrolase [Microbacterium]|uniref:Amidohydrolase n=1 Tax=Microbacterium wangchenii TaxID=2541726 RepID=A0ABX5SXT6_9MICO|nr:MULTISPECIES: amidohydrolase [Microbacterium]MCK6067433.1 amidohydrolase [Microbacterium sp. EYE_512]QBR89630.1 amidohydrolase [Microbacterium wangchenii]TXK16771.1 amidohydrolase [Microbacterium wangchenii]
MSATIYRNGRVFTADPDPTRAWADAFAVDGSEIVAVGDDTHVREAVPDPAAVVDLAGRLVLPGFTDAHTHVLMMGAALGQVALTAAAGIDDIQRLLAAARRDAPETTVLRGRGWLFDAVPGGRPTRHMIDAVVPDVPVYLDANDYHSCWVNTAALAELGITRETPDPLGGSIGRDEDGEPDGMLYETAAQQYAWAHRDATTTDGERDAAVDRVIGAYLAAGVTGVVDMAFDELGLAAFERAQARYGGELPIRVAAHWFVANTGDEAANIGQLARAAELASAPSTPWLRVVGIKLVLDGVIDACTAAMGSPYADGSDAEPIWSLEQLAPVVTAADARGLQIAMHAIGDRASDIALDAIEHAVRANGDRPRRHRIEHLEYAAPGTAERMARLGVTASMQPVHADPAIFANWAEMLGDERVERAFSWPEYEDAGALLAFSTDAPTAPYDPLANMYVASTRASALDPSVPAVHPQYAVPLDRAIGHATRDAAASVGDGAWRGRIAPGFAADLVILDSDPFAAGADALLTARVVETIVAGRSRWSAVERQR